MAAASSEAAAAAAEPAYKIKHVQFLGRETPIVLQNDNGPCPLIAICNVLLLRNALQLSSDVGEVSQQRLLALVAEKLIDCNSNVEDKDEAYVSNQQQNISDAIDLLPRLATGIDVNLHFRKINDFEFTRECAIFDLLDIGLYHGWIVDPQDIDTAAAIGSKSYNTLVAELVAFEAGDSDGKDKGVQEDDYVDFVAATTATLGVPSPTLSRGTSFDDHPAPVSDEQRRRKGDMEEEEELMKVLNASRVEYSDVAVVSESSVTDSDDASINLSGRKHIQDVETGITTDSFRLQIADSPNKLTTSDSVTLQECTTSNDCKGDELPNNSTALEKTVSENNVTNTVLELSKTAESFANDVRIEAHQGTQTHEHISEKFGSYEDLVVTSIEQGSTVQFPTENFPTSCIPENQGSPVNLNSSSHSGMDASSTDVGFSKEGHENVSKVDNLEESEPIYEGEERIVESGTSINENQEPVYEGEVVLAKQAEKKEQSSDSSNVQDNITSEQWLLVKKFLENNASQITIYGLFCLQEGLKERELCVFFRNNHFSTMFKFNGELYLLVTDQGYINEPDLVWEKLNEVNGNTIFVTSNFTEFKAEHQDRQSWNEQSVITSTTDFMARLENSTPSSDLNSDLQLAMALQQQEFEQQPQRQQHSQQEHPQQHLQQPVVPTRPRLVTGPQPPRNPSQRKETKPRESKPKDKCCVM